MDYFSLILFTLAACGTPGPNNTLLMASGASYGFRRTLPGVIGINTGLPLMVILVGVGLGGFLQRWPVILDLLRPVGALYLLYLAYRIATAPVDGPAATASRPMSFVRTLVFQFVNPKAWVLVVGSIVTYATVSHSFVPQILLIALIFMVFGTPCATAWCLAGAGLRRAIQRPAQFRVLNLVMATLLAVSLIPILNEIQHSLRADRGAVSTTVSSYR